MEPSPWPICISNNPSEHTIAAAPDSTSLKTMGISRQYSRRGAALSGLNTQRASQAKYQGRRCQGMRETTGTEVQSDAPHIRVSTEFRAKDKAGESEHKKN